MSEWVNVAIREWWRTVRHALKENGPTARLIAILVTCALIIGALASLVIIGYMVWRLI